MAKNPKKETQPESGEETVKKSVSFSGTVYDWAIELAKKKGYGSNFSAYIADLVRRDRERERELGFAEDLSAEVLEEALMKKREKKK